jgi:hypothetical protein
MYLKLKETANTGSVLPFLPACLGLLRGDRDARERCLTRHSQLLEVFREPQCIGVFAL